MACELWVRGRAENGGFVDVDVVWRSPWNSSDPIPAVSPSGRTGDFGRGTFSYYLDGFGGQFGGTGWYSVPEYYLKGCGDSISPNQQYDCLNGGCIPKATYNTPGVYASLAACESGCAKNSDCTGECVSAEELAALQQATDNLRSRYCG
jgi:hypothetical protein